MASGTKPKATVPETPRAYFPLTLQLRFRVVLDLVAVGEGEGGFGEGEAGDVDAFGRRAGAGGEGVLSCP